MLQVKGVTAAGGNPFAKGKKKPGELDPDEQETQDAAVDEAADEADPDAEEVDALLEETGDDPALPEEEDAEPGEDAEELDPDADVADKDAADPNDAAGGEPDDQADTIHPHEWAGDAYDEGDETDPGQAFAAFQGQGGEEAWLDRADDGTITGWVRDADGTVYRYSDDNAWATDVDDAGMQQTNGPQPGQQQPGQDDPTQQQQGPQAGGQPAQAPAGERSLFDDVAKKDAAGGLVVVDQQAIAAELAALGQPHLQAWAKQ